MKKKKKTFCKILQFLFFYNRYLNDLNKAFTKMSPVVLEESRKMFIVIFLPFLSIGTCHLKKIKEISYLSMNSSSRCRWNIAVFQLLPRKRLSRRYNKEIIMMFFTKANNDINCENLLLSYSVMLLYYTYLLQIPILVIYVCSVEWYLFIYLGLNVYIITPVSTAICYHEC